jgi:hypothetical protein
MDQYVVTWKDALQEKDKAGTNEIWKEAGSPAIRVTGNPHAERDDA